MTSVSDTRSRLLRTFGSRPVIGSLFTPDDVAAFLDGDCPVAILANGEISTLGATVGRLRERERFVFVNVDSTSGLAPDRGGIDFVAATGAGGVVTTRGVNVSRIESHGLVAVQKLFVTDRLNLPRSTHGIEAAQPSFVQIMPAPVLPYVMDEPVMRVSPVIAGGFVSGEKSLRAALACGARAVSTSDRSLWSFRKELS